MALGVVAASSRRTAWWSTVSVGRKHPQASASTAVRVLRGVGLLVLVAVAVLTLVVLAPFALHERTAPGSVADTAVDLPGQAHEATIGLRELGFSCSDAVTTTETVTRSCTRVRNLNTSQVQLVATADTGLIQLVESNVGEEWRDRARVHGDILGVVSRAIGLSPQEQEQVAAAAAATTAESVLDLGWGTAVVVTGLGHARPRLDVPGGRTPGPGLQPSPTTLAIPVDALATAAQAHGYTCTTPEVTSIRSCQRTVDGYRDDLWLQGTDTFTTSVELEHQRPTTAQHTRARWVAVMDQTLGWVDTAQTRSVRTWLAASADAPGAQAYVDGLPVSFHIRDRRVHQGDVRRHLRRVRPDGRRHHRLRPLNSVASGRESRASVSERARRERPRAERRLRLD